jgi:2-polyprenyl-3-methyl-5-hydroxy-6-metoxy-1,4-benzoquinol methylase
MRPWRQPWLAFDWGECTRCHSVQKLLSQVEYDNLNPTYDPGYEPNGAGSDDLMRLMDVAGKEALLRQALPTTHMGRLLDVGCGMGGFLLAGQRLGMDVTGIEPSASHSKAAVERFGLNVIHGYFTPDAVSGKFDVIVLSHVIEHIYKPGQFLSDLVSVLAPEGKLLIVTPNVDALTARWLGRYWSMFKPIDHVTMIGTRSVPYLVPAGTALLSAWTNEWPGEFSAHIISAMRTWWNPQIGNKRGTTPQKPSTRQATLGTLTRAALAIPSLPFRLLGKLLNRQSCLYAVFQKDSVEPQTHG